jgi:hypothetical protein
MIPKPLQQLSISDSLARFAWQGQVAVAAVTPAPSRPTVWQTTPVADFFGQYNWAGRSPAQLEEAASLIAASFSVRMPVQTFFACFRWGGNPQIAPPAIKQPMRQVNQRLTEPTTPPPAAGKQDLKLSNFSNLF